MSSIMQPITEMKPKLRGWIHAGTVPIAIALGVVLIVFARGAAAITGAAIFMATSLLLFGVSALYHRIPWQPRVKAIFRRIDHANIFLLIAGTYTPLSLMLLPPEKSKLLLALVWTGAIAGVLFRVFWIGAPRALYVALYLLLGWSAMLFVTDLFRASWITMTLVLIGGVLYSIGAAVYGFKRPNPSPKWFGFHEIFHSLTVAAFLCQWTGVFLAALGGATLAR
ncbi:MAG: hemolysin III family protein [Thermomicrobiales bacterium]|nr:hemolysin III family protein [Thermomicrobiales bacterium]